MSITSNSSESTPVGSCKSSTLTTISQPTSPQKPTGDVEKSAAPATETPIIPRQAANTLGGNDFTRHLSRSWGVRWVAVLIESMLRMSFRAKKEQKKVAIHDGIWYFCTASLFHLVPIEIGIGLASLNLVGHYVGRDYSGPAIDDSVKLVGYQIAAKMVELLCVASIARFILAFVRHELVSSRGIPFGLLASSLDFGGVKYPLSHEFWSVILAPAMQSYRRILFALALILSTILATLIGPTTAVLLQPRLEWWPAGGTDVWIDTTKDALFPSVINSSSIVQGDNCESTDNESCPSAGWEGLADWLRSLPFNDNPSNGPGHGSGISSSGLTLTVEEAQTNPMFGLRPRIADILTAQTWMFVPNIALARAFSYSIFLWYTAAGESQSRGETNFADYQDVYFSMVGLTPGVATRCNTTVKNPVGETCVSFPPAISSSEEDVATICGNAQLDEWINYDFASNRTQRPNLHWIDGSWDGPNNIGIEMPNGFSGAAIITVPGQQGASDSVVGCTIETHYSTLTYHKGLAISYPTGLSFGADTHTNVEVVDQGSFTSTVQTSWLTSLNPPLPKRNSDVFEQLIEAAGARGDEASGYAPYANRFEAVLLFMIGNGLARMQSTTFPITEITDFDGINETGPWWRSLLPQGATFGAGGNAFNVAADVRQRAVTNRMFVAVYGYAYAYFDSSGTLWSIIIVLAYVLFALVLFGVLMHQGCYSSTSWGSATELTALALESEPLEGDFINTTAGIDTLGPLKQSVRLTARNDRVQIVAANDTRVDDVEVKGNFEY